MVQEIGPQGFYRCVVTEILYPGSRMVVNYAQDELRLISVQARKGKGWGYLDHRGLEALSQAWQLPVCSKFSFATQDEIKNFLSNTPNFEGFVLHWPRTGFRLKLKSEEYCREHRLVSNIHPNRIQESLKSNLKENGLERWREILNDLLMQWPEEVRPPYEQAIAMLLDETHSTLCNVASICKEMHSIYDDSQNDFMKKCALHINKPQYQKEFDNVAGYHHFAITRSLALSQLSRAQIPSLDGKLLLKVWSSVRERCKF